MTRPAAPSSPGVAVVLASAGRPELLAQVMGDLARQTLGEHTLVLSVPDVASLPDHIPAHAIVVHDKGLPAQRNKGIEALGDAEFVFFFDDDAVLREDYLELGVRFFQEHREVVGLTGRVLLDGATGDAIPADVAAAALKRSRTEEARGSWRIGRELYGCNFGYRRSAAPDLRFDGRLPLYGWLEDHDFARRLMRYGVLARVEDCVIVHRGVKSGGRTAHERLGYSQVMNPSYLARTGSFPLWLTASEIGKRVAKNLVRSAVHEEREWRRERLLGNARAAFDVVRGRFAPERMLDIPVRR